MARVMAVAFERHGQLHYLDPGDGQYRVGQWVRYPTEDGVEVAQVVWAAEEVPEGLSDGTVSDAVRDDDREEVLDPGLVEVEENVEDDEDDEDEDGEG